MLWLQSKIGQFVPFSPDYCFCYFAPSVPPPPLTPHQCSGLWKDPRSPRTAVRNTGRALRQSTEPQPKATVNKSVWKDKTHLLSSLLTFHCVGYCLRIGHSCLFSPSPLPLPLPLPLWRRDLCSVSCRGVICEVLSWDRAPFAQRGKGTVL